MEAISRLSNEFKSQGVSLVGFALKPKAALLMLK
jgi:hypothetical protein